MPGFVGQGRKPTPAYGEYPSPRAAARRTHRPAPIKRVFMDFRGPSAHARQVGDLRRVGNPPVAPVSAVPSISPKRLSTRDAGASLPVAGWPLVSTAGPYPVAASETRIGVVKFFKRGIHIPYGLGFGRPR